MSIQIQSYILVAFGIKLNYPPVQQYLFCRYLAFQSRTCSLVQPVPGYLSQEPKEQNRSITPVLFCFAIASVVHW